MNELSSTPATRIHRHPERGLHERAALHAVLDEGLVAHVGLSQDGQPFVLPMAYARVGETLYLHGSKASRLVQHLGAGEPVCVTVTLLDGLVFARCAFNHSMNYRSAVVLGRARAVTELVEKRRAFEALVEHVSPGRSSACRPVTDAEANATAVVALSLAEASVKERRGGPLDAAEDLSWPAWAGEVPLRLVAQAPVPAAGVSGELPVPAPRGR